MSKPPARENDEVSNSVHGQGNITTGDPTVTFEGQPIACVGDTAKFEDTVEGTIQEGNTCVVVNGKRIALVGDSTDKDGTISQGANTIQVDEGDPFVFIGPNVSIGENVIFSCNSKGYDEAIQFTDSEGKPLGAVSYKLYVGDNQVHEGVTNANGITMRIVTEEPQAITKALIKPVNPTPFCCAASLSQVSGTTDPLEVNFDGVQTNQNQLDKSVAKHAVHPKVRPMTAGEVSMCQLIFKDATDYSKVKIYKGAFLWGSGDNAMTPFGNPHFPVIKDSLGHDIGCQDDFSEGDNIGRKVWFIHEMTHVWQYQMGYGVISHGIWISLKGGYSHGDGKLPPLAYRYNYNENPANKRFSDFNMEQQADIVAYYYAVEFLDSDYSLHQNSYQFNQIVIRDFLANPKNKNLLPHTTHF